MGTELAALLGATFRCALGAAEHAAGELAFDGRELALLAGAPRWRLVGDEAWHDGTAGRLTGLARAYAAQGVAPGDDVLVHVQALAPLALVLDFQSRMDRDEAAIERANRRLANAALAALNELGGGWQPLVRLQAALVERGCFRGGTPSDGLAERLLRRDDRFALDPDSGRVRPSHFRRDDTAKAYLSRVGSPAEALPAFFEEWPPASDEDTAKAAALLEAWWRDTPRPELGGRTPAQAEADAAKIVPFPRSG